MTNIETGMRIAELIFEIAKEILEHYLESDDFSQMRLKDLKAWRKWEQEKAEPNMKKLLEEYRKRLKK